MLRHIKHRLRRHREIVNGFFNAVAYMALFMIGALFLKIGVITHII